MAWEPDGYVSGAELSLDAAGIVVMASDRTTGTDVAIRFLAAGLCGSTEFMARFRAEMTELEVIEPTNVAQVYELIERDGRAALVTQLVDGPALRNVLRRGPLTPEAALYVMAGVLTGLAALHSRDVKHRALSAESVLVDSEGVIKLVDVGLAGPGVPTLNPAPEQRDGGPASVAADVYAAYMVLLECLTGVRHPDAGTGVPSWLQVAMTVGLADHPGSRYPDAATALYQLQLVAARALGPDWYTAGRASLMQRSADSAAMSGLVSTAVLPTPDGTEPRPADPPAIRASTPRPAWVDLTHPSPVLPPPPPDRAKVTRDRSEPSRAGRVRRVVAGIAALVLVLGAAAWVVVLALSPVPDPPATAITNTHVPMLTEAGPSVPVPPTAGPRVDADTAVPATPAGLSVTSRSRTSVSLDWAPSVDNVQVAGYILVRNGKQIGTTRDPGYTDNGLAPMSRYQYAVAAFDDGGNISATSEPVMANTLAEADRYPPTVPVGVHTTGKSVSSIVLAWAASRDNVGVAGYEVYRDGKLVANVGQPGFTDTGLAPASTHTYRVRAFDTSNNASGDSAATTATTLTAPDTTAPSTPDGLGAIGTSQSTIDISWHPATDNVGVTGYRLFRGGIKIADVYATSYTDQGLAPDTGYTYAVEAIDAAGNRSGRSAPVSASTTPTPTTPPTPDPTTDPPTTTPAPEIMSVILQKSVNGCQVGLEATVTASGPMDATLSYNYTVGGVTGTIALSFTETSLSWTGSLPPPDTTADGTATVDAGGMSDVAGWTACVVDPPTTEPSTPDGAT